MTGTSFVAGMQDLPIIKKQDTAVGLTDDFNAFKSSILKRKDLTENIWCFQSFQNGAGTVWFVTHDGNRAGSQKSYLGIVCSELTNDLIGMERMFPAGEAFFHGFVIFIGNFEK